MFIAVGWIAPMSPALVLRLMSKKRLARRERCIKSTRVLDTFETQPSSSKMNFWFPRKRSSSSSKGWILTAVLLPFALSINNPPGTCYYPSGEIASDFLPCDAYAYITQCCPSGWTCFSNSLCVVTDPRAANATYPIATTIRAGCTNSIWNNAICGDFCLSTQATIASILFSYLTFDSSGGR
jgi:hypothetical protein